MKSVSEKKGWLARLAESRKAKKNSCCSIEIVEIPEENTDTKNDRKLTKEDKSCCE